MQISFSYGKYTPIQNEETWQICMNTVKVNEFLIKFCVVAVIKMWT